MCSKSRTFWRAGSSETTEAVNAVTKAIIETNGAAGFTVQLYGKNGQNVVEAVNEETDETFVVRGKDWYLVAVELAQQCGIELEDG